MASGCIVIGYDGLGGKEYFDPDYSYPVPHGDIIEFCKTVEKVMRIHQENPSLLKQKSEKAAVAIQTKYTEERERKDILSFWTKMMGRYNK